MPKIFVQSDNDEQPVEYTGDLAELVPNEVFFKDGRYRAVVDESVTRRKTIKELQALLDAAKAEDPATTPVTAPEPVVQTPTVVVPTVDELYETFKARQAAEREATEQANAALIALLEPNGLTRDDLPLLENAKNPAILAVELGRRKLSFANSGVNPANPVTPQSLFDKINADLGLK